MDTSDPYVIDDGVYIDNVPFRLNSYHRSNTNNMVALFGSPEHGDTNLDLLKVITQKSFRGGMFQRAKFEDPEMVSSISGGYYNDLDDALYAAQTYVSREYGANMDEKGVISYAYWRGSFYFTWRSTPPNATNRISRLVVSSGDITDLTLPTTLQNIERHRGLTVTAFEEFLFIGTVGGGNNTPSHRYNGTTFTSVSGNFQDFVEFRSKLYGVTGDNLLYLITDHKTSPMKWSLIKSIALKDTENFGTYRWSYEFNGALYFGFGSGLYRFDGVDIDCIINHKVNVDIQNFRYAAVWNGRLYYSMGNQLHSFDGINVQLVQDLGDAYTIKGITSGKDRLWLGVMRNNAIPSIDSFGVATNQYQHALFCYNGVGFFEYCLFPADYALYSSLAVLAGGGQVFVFYPYTYLNFSSELRSNGYGMRWFDMTKEFTPAVSTDQIIDIYGTEMDMGYPSVPKVLNGALLDFENPKGTAGHHDVSLLIRPRLNGVYGDWIHVGITTSAGDLIFYDSGTPVICDSFQYRLRVRKLNNGVPTSAPFRLRKITFRYVLQPALRKEWLLGLSLDPMHEKPASYYRNVLDRAIRDKLPVLMYDADCTRIRKQMVDVSGSQFWVLIMQVGDSFTDSDVVAVRSPLDFRWFNIKVRIEHLDSETLDDLGITLAPGEVVIDVQDIRYVSLGGGILSDFENLIASPEFDEFEVRHSRVVYITDVQNERYILDRNSLNISDGLSDIPSEITVIIKEI